MEICREANWTKVDWQRHKKARKKNMEDQKDKMGVEE